MIFGLENVISVARLIVFNLKRAPLLNSNTQKLAALVVAAFNTPEINPLHNAQHLQFDNSGIHTTRKYQCPWVLWNG